MEKKHETSTSLKLGMRMHTDCMLTAQMHACSMLSQGLYAWTYLIHRTRLGGINATLVLKLVQALSHSAPTGLTKSVKPAPL